MTDGLVRECLLYVADLMISLGILKGTILLGLTLALVRGSRGASAATRAGLWGVAIVALALLPVLTHIVPWWELGFMNFPRVLFVTDSALHTTLAELLRAPDEHAGPPFALWLGLLWVCGALGLGMQFLRQRIGVALAVRASEPARDRRTLACAAEVAAALGMRRLPRLAYSRATPGPFVFGAWRPTVVLPIEARDWTLDRLDAVLRHEFAHITRADYALLIAGEVVRALYWFNPAVWWALRALRRNQDSACDDLVLRSGMQPIAYARHLVDVARSMLAGPRPQRAALPFIGRRSLRERVDAVLSRGSDRRPITRRAGVWGCAVALLVVLTIASANPWICSTDTQPAEQDAAPALPERPAA